MTARPQSPSLIDDRLLAALSHPVRSYFLTASSERPVSPAAIARELNKDVSAVDYHVKKLLDLGCIEEVASQKRRGATEHFYRATVMHMFTTEAWAAIPEHKRFKFTADILGLVSMDIGEALINGTIERDDNHISRSILNVDPQGWGELVDLLGTTLEAVQQIKSAVARRGRDTPEDKTVIRASVSILQVEMPPHSARP